MYYIPLFLAQNSCLENLKALLNNDEEPPPNPIVDVDEDGHASIESGGDDCDDSNPNVNPSMSEICDAIDNDCDEEIDEDIQLMYYADDDGDGFANDIEIVTCMPEAHYILQEDIQQFDCDDRDAQIHPNMEERCDGIDNNCDMLIDDEQAIDKGIWFWDADGDGYPVQENVLEQCDQPEHYIFIEIVDNTTDDISWENSESTDDTATETLEETEEQNTEEQNTEEQDTALPDTGLQDENTEDVAYVLPSSLLDCDDGNALIHPTATEYCDDIDWNCDEIERQPNTITFQYNDQQWNVTDYFEDTIALRSILNSENILIPETYGTVLFCPGTYNIEIISDISVIFQGFGEVIWDGNGEVSPLTVETSTDTIDVFVQDITIQHGFATHPYYMSDIEEMVLAGGGIFCDGSAHLYIDTINFLENYAERGGAIFTSALCSVSIQNSLFSLNTGNYGGGLYLSGNAVIENSLFENNQVDEIFGQGGALYADGTRFFQSILDTESEFHSTNLMISNTIFTENTANQGAGIFAEDVFIRIEHSDITQNTATTGAGVYQRATHTSIVETTIQENNSDIGSAVYLADSTSQLQNRFSCTQDSYIISNLSENTSAAVSIDGTSLFLAHDCFFGANTWENTHDIQHQESIFISAISANWNGQCNAWSCTEQEDCNLNEDSNNNGLIGWDDPTCQYDLSQNFVPSQLISDIYDPPFSCYDNSTTILQIPDLLQTYMAPTSGCLSITTDFQEQFGSLISVFDAEQTLLSCVDGGNLEPPLIEESVQKYDERYIVTSLYDGIENPGAVGVELTSGYDCDGNCCYDIYLTDQFEFGGGYAGDGWNGSFLEIYEEDILIQNISMTESSEQWVSFCITTGNTFSLYYNNEEQEPYAQSDIEGFSIYQGEMEICQIQDATLGWIDGCSSTICQ